MCGGGMLSILLGIGLRGNKIDVSKGGLLKIAIGQRTVGHNLNISPGW